MYEAVRNDITNISLNLVQDMYEAVRNDITNISLNLLQDMYEAVRNGDYMSLNNALDKKNADINMTWVIHALNCTEY